MTYQTTKLTLVISLVLFWGFADLAFGQARRIVRPPSAQQEQSQQGTQQQRTRQSVAPAVPQQRVLIVSAGRLPDAPNFGGLNGADFDADALARAFEKSGIPRENVFFISQNGWTQEAVLGRLEEMKMSSRAGDSLIVVLIGKTVQKQGLHYFCAADTTDAAITGNNANRGLVRISALAEQISSCAATHKALILDLVGKDGFPDFSNLEPEGIWLLTSAAAREESLREGGLVPGSREVRGVFNYYLTQGLLGMADLIGNNDGVVSFNELANYATQNTRVHAEKVGTRQTPQMLGTMVQQVGTTAVFNIGQKMEGTLAANRHVFDESHLINSLSDYLASAGNAIVMSAQADLRRSFGDADKRSSQQENNVDVRDYLKRQGDANAFAIANFLNRALDDPENKMARLAIATAKRACGDYDDALRNYDDAGELFELFVIEPTSDVTGKTSSQFGNDLTLERVSLYSEASANSRTVTQLPRGAKVFAQKFAKGRSGQPNDDWINVRVYPYMEPNYVEGWIHRDYIFWSPEAAEWYTPLDGLARMYEKNALAQAAVAKNRAALAQRAAKLSVGTGIASQYVGGWAGVGLGIASQALGARSQRQAQLSAVAWNNFYHWQNVGAEHLAELKTVEDQTKYFEGARIIVDPNDLPF